MAQQLHSDTFEQSFVALLQVTDVASTTPDLCAIAELGLERALAMTAVTSGSIWLYDGSELACIAHRPVQTDISWLASAVLRVIKSGQIEYIPLEDDQSVPVQVIVPLTARGEPTGALALGGATSAPPGLLEAIASAIASALQHAQLAEQVATQRQRLQTIQRQHDELIAIISHDLKNPMASIKGYADLLLRRSERNPDDPNRRGLQVISEQIVRMNGLLDKLLDLSRITAKRLRIDRRPADLAYIVSQVVADLRTTTERSELTLEGADTTCIGAFDVGRVRQAIENVIANAIAYSPAGSPVTVRLERTPHEAIVSVMDRGIGIPADECERIFEPFFRASNIASRSGMGMGLFVAQQILMRHEGRIWFQSAEGQGSTFYIALPVNAE
jgi:signal transduction histidine kinase